MTIVSRLGYGVGVFGPMLGWVAAQQYLLYYYTDVIGLAPALAGLILLVGMIWDALTDPVVGILADRTQTRWGRYRPYLLFSAVPFALCVALAFFPPGFNISSPFITALVTHLLFRTGYTLVYMPYTAMIARITDSYDSRTDLTAAKTAFVFLANLAISFSLYSMVETLGQGQEQVGFFRAAVIIGVIAATTTLLCFRLTKEPVEQPEVLNQQHKLSLIGSFRDMVGNKPFALLFVGVAMFGGFYAAEISMTPYFAKYWLGDAAHTRTLFTTQAVFSLISIPAWLWLGKKYGKKEVWIGGTFLAAFGLMAIYFIRPQSVEAMAALYALTNVGATGFILIFYAITADTVDWGEWLHRRRHEGVMFGAISFANKAFAGLATGSLATLLGWAGFEANVDQSGEVMNALFVIGILVPGLAFVATALIMIAYPINRERHAQIMSEIDCDG